MNSFELQLQKILGDNNYMLDGIEFNHAILVNLFIDSLMFRKFKFLDVSLIVFSELLRSLAGNGLYLIFTSASGIADDGGWDGVLVSFNDEIVSWEFEVEDEKYHFEFNRLKYEEAILNVNVELDNISKELELEPTEIFFPESWD